MMKKLYKTGLFKISLLLFLSFSGMQIFAQAPTISYSGAQTYTTGVAISPLVPTSSNVGSQPFSTPAAVNGNFKYVTGRGLAVDAAGNIFASQINDGELTEFPAVGGAPISLNTGVGGDVIANVAVDASGNVYFSTVYSTTTKEIPAGGNTAVAAAPGFSFPSPVGTATDAAGNSYKADNVNGAIIETPASGGSPVTVVSGINIGGGIAVGASGNIYYNTNNGLANGAPSGDLFKVSRTGGYTISPGLPAGLTFNATTGTISGTPTAASPATNYTIIAYSSTGSNTATVNITVKLPLPAISYNGPQTYTVNIGITPLTPTINGGVAPVYNNSPVTLGSGFSNPEGVAVDASGNVYVADYFNNAIYKVPYSNGTYGAPIALGFGFKPAGVAVDAAGNVYVGDFGNSAVKKIPYRNGIYGTPITIGSGFSSPQGVAVDVSGNVYVADYYNNAVKKIPYNNGTYGVPVSLGSGFLYPFGVAVDASGNVFVADPSNNSIVKIPYNNGVYGTQISIGSGFTDDPGVAVDAAGNVYVSDNGHNMIKEILFNNGNYSNTPITLVSGLNHTLGVAVDASGNVYFSNTNGAMVEKLSKTGGYSISPALPAGLSMSISTGTISGTPTAASPATNYIITANNGGNSSTATINLTVKVPIVPNISYSGPQTFTKGITITTLTPTSTGGVVPATIFGQVSNLAGSTSSGSANGTGTAASFGGPFGSVTDAAGNVYVAENYNNLIRKITPGGVVTTFAGSGARGSANGMGTAASFNGPAGIGIDASGNLYVAEVNSNLIRKITPAGLVSTFAGTGSRGSTNGQANISTFYNPYGIAVDPSGNVYVADQGNHLIRKITSAGMVSTFAGSGSPGSSNGTGIAASFFFPAGLATDALGNVYVADAHNNMIREISPSGFVSTLAGSTTQGSLNGIGAAASFTFPQSVAVDISGNVYVADENNNLIRAITPSGLVTTLAGSGVNGSLNGVGATATVGSPIAIAVDNLGNVYFASNNMIRKIIITGYNINPALPAGLTFNSATGAISGTPTAGSPATDYTITAYNKYGSSSANLNIAVNVPVPPTINYNGSKTFTVGTAIAPLMPTSSGVAAPAYSSVLAPLGSGFASPYGTAVDAAGNVYVTDYSANTVSKIPAGGSPAVVIGTGFSNPSGVAVDAAGNVYVTDAGNNVVKKISAGGGAPVVVCTGLNDPLGIAVDAAGNVYVSNYGANTVMKIPAGGGNPITIGTGFNRPIGLAVDAAGNVYVANSQSSSIEKIPAAGGSPVFMTDYFYFPTGVAVDNAGNVYVADYGNKSVSVLKPSKGAEPWTPTILNSGLNYPFGLAMDGAGNMFVSNSGTKSVLKINPVGGFFINPALPAGLNFDRSTGYISGTPAIESAATDYTVTAYNLGGSSTAKVNITVNHANFPGQITDLAVTSVSNTSVSLTWKDGSFDGRGIFITNAQTGTVTPVYGKGYNKGDLAGGGWVSYGTLVQGFNQTPSGGIATQDHTGVAGGTTVTGLTPGTSYRVSVLEVQMLWYNNFSYGIAGGWVTGGQYPINFSTTGVAPLNSVYKPGYDAPGSPLISSIGSEKVLANNILSPNGDGINDIWVIKNIAFHPDNKVTVYNASGTVVFTKKNYANDWAGTYNGAVLKEGTYYYSIELPNENPIKGFITVIKDK